MSKAWRIALRNLARNRRRNLATGFAIALGYAGLVLLGGYVARVEHFLRTTAVYLQHSGHVTIFREQGLEKAMARPAKFSLGPDDQARIDGVLRGDPRVEFTARFLRGMGLAGNGCRTVPFAATGLEPDVEARLLSHPEVRAASPEFAEPVRGRPVSRARDVEGAVGLSVGLARLLGKTRVHDEVPTAAGSLILACGTPEAEAQVAADANIQLAGLSFDGSLAAIDGEVVNVFHTPSADTEDQTVETTLATLQGLYATDAVTYVAVYLRDHRQAEAMAKELGPRLRAAGVPAAVYAYTDERVNAYYAGTMTFLGSLVTFITVLVIAVVVLGVMNATTLTVFERTRELGTLRALGYTRRHVVALYLRELAILTAIGLAAGLVLALAIAAVVKAANVRFLPPGVPGSVQVIVTPSAGLCALVAAVMLPLVVLMTWAVVRRRVRLRTADLLTATTA